MVQLEPKSFTFLCLCVNDLRLAEICVNLSSTTNKLLVAPVVSKQVCIFAQLNPSRDGYINESIQTADHIDKY